MIYYRPNMSNDRILFFIWNVRYRMICIAFFNNMAIIIFIYLPNQFLVVKSPYDFSQAFHFQN